MPELPEVTTIINVLNNILPEKKIDFVEVFDANFLKNIDIDSYTAKLAGQKVHKIRRKGKYLLFDFDDYTMVSHLRMEGKFNYYDEYIPRQKHDYIIIKFEDGSSLHYNDTRKFGTIELVNLKQENSLKSISKLGVEPLSDEFTLDYIKSKMVRKKITIKQFLLDQTIVVGFGNIYVDEVLYLCNIHPKTSVNLITDPQIELIIENGKELFKRAIENGGSTVKSYEIREGKTGNFQHLLNVYGREGQECPKCLTKIVKIKVGGRGTHFCPNCQKEIDDSRN